MPKKSLTNIGRNVAVDFMGHAHDVPAKVDTGADSSSVWASGIAVDDSGVLHFVLFDKQSPYYTGEIIKRDKYKVAMVMSTTGHRQIRYRAEFLLRIKGRNVRAAFNLSDRSHSTFPVLIGRRTLSNKFIVDVSKCHYENTRSWSDEVKSSLNKSLRKDPVGFYKQYFGKDMDSEV